MSAVAATRPVRADQTGHPVFRQAGRGDLGVLKPLYRSACDAWARSLGREPTASNFDWLLDAVDEGAVWIAKRGGHVLGAMTLARAGDTWSIDEIVVSPLRQGRGIGSWMLARAGEKAPDQGIGRLQLCTAKKRTDLVAWYGRSGFSIVREIPGSRFRDGQIRVHMEKRLS